MKGDFAEEIARLLEQRLRNRTAGAAVRLLSQAGLLDGTRCRALLVRREVDRLTAAGMPKTHAMERAGEKYCCSYEQARNCIYYYKDTDLK